MKKFSSILVVDDSEADAFIACHYLKKSGRAGHIWCLSDGDQAISAFREPGQYAESHQGTFPPEMVLLDINMPRVSGFEFLAEFRRMSPEQGPVIVIMTSSEAPTDVARANELGVADYLVKPLSPEKIEELAERFGSS